MILQLLLKTIQSKYRMSQPSDAVYEPMMLLLDNGDALLTDDGEVVLI